MVSLDFYDLWYCVPYHCVSVKHPQDRQVLRCLIANWQPAAVTPSRKLRRPNWVSLVGCAFPFGPVDARWAFLQQ